MGNRILSRGDRSLAALGPILIGVAVVPWLIDPIDFVGLGAPREAEQNMLVSESPRAPRVVPPLESLSATVERPIFTATRRPVKRAPSPDKSLILGKYELTGRVISPGKRMILMRTPGGGSAFAVGQGEKVDGWLVTEVTATKIVLQAVDRRVVITDTKTDTGTVQVR